MTTIFAITIKLSPLPVIVLRIGCSVEYSVGPETVITHHLWYLAGPRKELFYSFKHDKSDGMYANNVRQLVTHEIKRDFANRK